MKLISHGKVLVIRRAASRSWVLRIEGDERERRVCSDGRLRQDVDHFLKHGSIPA